MHPCLAVEEIINQILSHLAFKDILSMALTCTLFKETALRELWTRNQFYSMHPIFTLLPRDTWHAQPSLSNLLDSRRVFYATRKIVPEDWIPASRYASWVRKLCLVYNDPDPLLESICHALNGRHIFPNLQSLKVQFFEEESIQYVKTLLSPRLTHLDLIVPYRQDFLALLTKLGSLCPLLNYLRFLPAREVEVSNYPVINSCVSQGVLLLKFLKSIRVAFLSYEALEYISSLPDLHHLEIWSSLDPEVVPAQNSPFSGFPSLRFLHISVYDLGCATQLLQMCRTKTLWMVRIASNRDPSERDFEEDWGAFFKALSLCSSASAELRLRMLGFSKPRGSALGYVQDSALLPLLAAHNLVALQCDKCELFNLTDGFIEQLAKSSPNLAILDIGSCCVHLDEPGLTLNAWRHIFTHCSEIHTLGLYVDTDTELVVQLGQEHKSTIVHHGRSFNLFVSASQVKDANKLAAFLLPFFRSPIRFRGSAEGFEPEEWKVVGFELSRLIRARDISVA